VSEPQTWTACGSGTCTVNIPAAASRVLYYVVDRKTSAGAIVSGPLTVLTVN
jgi:hypothetical protein